MSQLKVNSIVDAAGGSSAVLYGVASPPNSMGFRNRLINSDMRIDQRNAGASVTPGSGIYVLDRWRNQVTQTSRFSVQRNAGAVTPPPGFTNYMGITSLSAYALTGNDSFSVEQIVEGFNIADFNWGTANAIPATLSFWVRSSLTGTFGGSLATANGTIWVVPFSYTISSANTWTYITVAIPAGTSAVPFTDNQGGIFVRFGLGSTGTAAGGTAGVWTSAGNFVQPSGTVSVVGTNGATWQITGVQLEAGSVASPFERIDYGRQLIQCQRYYQVRTAGSGTAANSTTFVGTIPFAVDMRASPTVGLTSALQVTDMWSADYTQSSSNISIASARVSTSGVNISASNFSGMTQARPEIINIATGGAITLSSEL